MAQIPVENRCHEGTEYNKWFLETNSMPMQSFVSASRIAGGQQIRVRQNRTVLFSQLIDDTDPAEVSRTPPSAGGNTAAFFTRGYGRRHVRHVRGWSAFSCSDDRHRPAPSAPLLACDASFLPLPYHFSRSCPASSLPPIPKARPAARATAPTKPMKSVFTNVLAIPT